MQISISKRVTGPKEETYVANLFDTANVVLNFDDKGKDIRAENPTLAQGMVKNAKTQLKETLMNRVGEAVIAFFRKRAVSGTLVIDWVDKELILISPKEFEKRQKKPTVKSQPRKEVKKRGSSSPGQENRSIAVVGRNVAKGEAVSIGRDSSTPIE